VGSRNQEATLAIALQQESAGKPPIPMRPSIVQYSRYELMQLIAWVLSDDQLRTDDEIISEMVSVLGFSRRGARIETAIRNAVQAYRASESRRT
jgi:hypothetical protein